MDKAFVEKLSKKARLSTKTTNAAAGWDLYAAYSNVIPPGHGSLILTDLSTKLPPGVYGRITPRSGMTIMYGINIGAGVIDPDYRGNIGVYLFNHGKGIFGVKAGNRIAQIIFEKYLHDAKLVENRVTTEGTERDDKKFGSSDAQSFAKKGSDCCGNFTPLNLSMPKL